MQRMLTEGRRLAVLGLAVLLFLPAACVYPPNYGRVTIADKNARVDLVFSDREQVIIRDYYRAHLPPGLAKKGKVPPGHRKKLARQGYLSPGLAWQPLPRELELRLARLPEGYVRIRIGTDVAIMDVRTRLILDVVHDL